MCERVRICGKSNHNTAVAWKMPLDLFSLFIFIFLSFSNAYSVDNGRNKTRAVGSSGRDGSQIITTTPIVSVGQYITTRSIRILLGSPQSHISSSNTNISIDWTSCGVVIHTKYTSIHSSRVLLLQPQPSWNSTQRKSNEQKRNKDRSESADRRFRKEKRVSLEWTGGCAISNLRWRQSDPVIHCPRSHLNFAPSAISDLASNKQTFFAFLFFFFFFLWLSSAIRIPRNCDNSVTGGGWLKGGGMFGLCR